MSEILQKLIDSLYKAIGIDPKKEAVLYAYTYGICDRVFCCADCDNCYFRKEIGELKRKTRRERSMSELEAVIHTEYGDIEIWSQDDAELV